MSFDYVFRPFTGMKNILEKFTSSCYIGLMACLYTSLSATCGTILIIFWGFVYSCFGCYYVYIFQPQIVCLKMATNVTLVPMRLIMRRCCFRPLEDCCIAMCIWRRPHKKKIRNWILDVYANPRHATTKTFSYVVKCVYQCMYT